MILRMTALMTGLSLASLTVFEASGIDIDWAVALTGLAGTGLIAALAALRNAMRETSENLETLPF